MANVSEGYFDERTVQHLEFEKLVRIIIPIIFGLVFITGCTGNIFVLIISFKFKNMKTINNVMIFALATADLCFLALCVPFTALGYTLTKYHFGRIWCKISNYIIYVSAYVSVYFMCLMSMDRFLAIVYPLSSKRFRTRSNIYTGIACALFFSFSVNIQIFFVWEYQEYYFYEEERSVCASIFAKRILVKIFFLTFGIFNYCIPIIVITVLNGSIFITLLRTRSFMSSNISRNVRAAKIVFAIELGYFVCWTPIHVVIFLQNFTNVNSFMEITIAQFIGNVLAYSNSCLNPILYTFVCKEYREKMKELLNMNN
ncbi:allatostatin-A receptor-like [Mercenaria mercenaria]|uniref:allatostatin-A receptor-like n=1 Tax=Mercenaria mercenaria TaxID=6596 RepID=UPI00234F4B8B|nr:allatostatin-A receptor-like [Mercenaria mercenaria]